MEITKEIYRLVDKFPQEEKFALSNQLIRSGVSISSNIAEGSYRTTNKEFSRFLDMALGSSAEAETQLIIAEWRGYISSLELKELVQRINSVQRRTNSFKSKILRT